MMEKETLGSLGIFRKQFAKAVAVFEEVESVIEKHGGTLLYDDVTFKPLGFGCSGIKVTIQLTATKE